MYRIKNPPVGNAIKSAIAFKDPNFYHLFDRDSRVYVKSQEEPKIREKEKSSKVKAVCLH